MTRQLSHRQTRSGRDRTCSILRSRRWALQRGEQFIIICHVKLKRNNQDSIVRNRENEFRNKNDCVKEIDAYHPFEKQSSLLDSSANQNETD